MDESSRNELEAAVEAVLKLHAPFPVSRWHVMAGLEGGKILVTVSPKTFFEGKRAEERLAEVKRILSQHLPAKLNRRWRVLDIQLELPPISSTGRERTVLRPNNPERSFLRPSVYVWLD